MSNEITTPEPRLQCRHILTSGHRCGSPCLRHEPFCYYHHTTRKPAPKNGTVRPRLELPLPEDRSAIQHAIGQVLQRIAEGKINPRRAGLLLYGLQIASHNLPRALPQSPIETVDEAEDLPGEGLLAPEAEFAQAHRQKTLVEILEESWQQEKREIEEDERAAKAQVHA